MLHDRDYMYESSRSHRDNFIGGESVLKPLIWANIAIYLLQILTNHAFTSTLNLNAGAIRNAEIWRVVSYMFAHGSFTHILFNMWGLYLFGRMLEPRIGPKRFLHVYFASGILGGLAWLALNWQPLSVFSTLAYPRLVGASGGVFGIMIATAMLFPNQMIMLLFPPIPMKLKTFALIFGGIEVMMAFEQGGNIAHIAHLGGALAGYLYIHYNFRAPWSPFDFIFAIKSFFSGKSAKRTRQQFRMHNNQSHNTEDRADLHHDVDRILDKIGSQGLQSLTQEERRTLEEARKRLRRQ